MSGPVGASAPRSAPPNAVAPGGVRSFFAVARAVAWRQIRNAFTRPSLLVPALFPLFFFAAFAGGLSRVGEVPGFEFAAGYTAFQYVWVLLQSMSFGGAFTGFSIARDFESGFARRLLVAAPNRKGIVFGYLLASLVRSTFTGALVTGAAFVAGMQILGTGVDLFGLFGLAITVNIAATLFTTGVALMLRTQQAGPLMQTPIFLALFLAPVFVPMELLEGWISTIAALNPITLIIEGGRGFILGESAGAGAAFLAGAALVALLLPWALFGLGRAERSG